MDLPGAAGCQPNLIIIVAPNGNAVAREIVDTRRDLLGYYGDDATVTAGRDALEAFANTPRAVRWWHVADLVSADGRRVDPARLPHRVVLSKFRHFW